MFFEFLLVKKDVVSLATFPTSPEPASWAVAVSFVVYTMINFHQPIRGSSSGQLESLASWHRKCRHGGHSMPPMLKGRDIQPNKNDGISQGKLCIDWVGVVYWPLKNKTPSCVLRVVKIWRSPPGMYKPMRIVGDHINLLSGFLPSTVVQQLP